MEQLRRRDDGVPLVVAATASPFKFPATVASALGLGAAETKARIDRPASSEEADAAAVDELDIAENLARHAGLALPAAVRELRHKRQRHRAVIAPERMKTTLIDLLEHR